MAYKFQLGQARLSGSVIQEGDVTAESSQLNASTLDLSDASGIAGDGMEDQSGNLGIATDGVTNDMLAGAIASSKIAELNNFDTADLAENASNLYYTDARSRAAVSADVSANSGRGSLAYNSSTGVFSYEGVTQAEIRGDISVTDAGGDGSLSYDNSTGVITYTGPSAAEVRAHLSGGEMIDFASGEMAINASEFSASALAVVDANPSNVRAHLSGGEMIDFVSGEMAINDSEFSASALAVIDANPSNVRAHFEELLTNSVDLSYSSATGQISADVLVDADALEVTAGGVSLKSTIAGSRTFSGDVEIAGGLNVQGSLTYIETTNLAISDALITIGSGSSAFAADYGMEFGAVDGGWASLKTAADIDDEAGPAVAGFEFSHPVKASRFYGELVGSMVEKVQTLTATATIDTADGAQILLDHATAQTFTLPAAVDMEGLVLKIKRIGSGEATIEPASGQLEGGSSIKLESQGAAVSIICDGTNYYVI